MGIFFGTALLAFAVSSFFTSKGFVIGNTKDTQFSIDLTGTVDGIAVLPGTEQSVNTSIKNTGTEKMYVFVRFDTSTTAEGSSIYAFSTSGWDAVDSGAASQLLYVYGSFDAPTPLNPGESAELSGTLQVVATGADFSELTDDDFTVTVNGCAVGGPESEGTGAQLYAEYLGLGGE